MNDHVLLLSRIIDVWRTRGLAEAVAVTRTAFEAGQLAAIELPEILLALRRGDVCALSDLTEHAPSPPLVDARAA